MKKLNLLGLSVVTIGLFTGCGSSSNSVATGTGFYVDSAVDGIDYVCGTKSGTTGADGKFTFDVGEDCSFSVAGVPLRTTKADDLEDGGQVLEDNATVARFLQSIDNDNNASNGIQIKSEILEVLTQALADHNSTGKIPINTVLENVIGGVKNDVQTFDGGVKTPEEVTSHLTETQGDITKSRLAGKTFYVVGQNVTDATDTWQIKATFNADVTEVTSVENGKTQTVAITSIKGNRLEFSDNTDGSYTVIGKDKGDYTELTDYLSNGSIESHTRAYSDEAKAKAYYGSLATSTESTAANILAGKTFYAAYTENGVNTVERHIVNADATHDTWTQVFGQSNSGTDTIAISGNIVTFSSDNSNDSTRLSILEVTDKYIKIKDADTGEIDKVYFSLEDAKATFGSSSATINATLSDLIVGKTYHVATNDSYTDENGNTVNNDHVETLAFGTDGKLHDTWIENGTQQEVVMDYSINGDTLSIVTPNDGTITFTNVETLSNHIRFTDANGEESGRFFFTYADAEATLNNN